MTVAPMHIHIPEQSLQNWDFDNTTPAMSIRGRVGRTSVEFGHHSASLVRLSLLSYNHQASLRTLHTRWLLCCAPKPKPLPYVSRRCSPSSLAE